GHDACFEQLARKVHSTGTVADDDGSYGRLAGGRGLAADVEAQRAQLLFEVTRVLPQFVDALRLLLQDFEGGDAGGGHRWRMRSREQKWPGAVVEKINQVARAANVAAERADGFGERADLDVHAPVDVEMINGSAAVAAQHAGGVSVIHHHDGAVLFGEIA